jgi:hypothetical protein
MKLLITALVLLQYCTLANAQEATPPAAPVASPSGNTADPGLPSGTYRGRVTEIGGTRSSDFEIIWAGQRGTIQMYRATGVCNRPLPLNAAPSQDGILRLEAKEGAFGCERIFELKVSARETTGKMTFIDGRVYDVTMKKQ